MCLNIHDILKNYCFSDQVMHYVRSLEQRVKQLEEEKLTLQQKLGQVPGTNNTSGNWENDVRDHM